MPLHFVDTLPPRPLKLALGVVRFGSFGFLFHANEKDLYPKLTQSKCLWLSCILLFLYPIP